MSFSSKPFPPELKLRLPTRKKRPSFSPQKWRSVLTPEKKQQRSHSYSSSTTSKAQVQESPMRNPKTAALSFAGFSFIGDQGGFETVDAAWLDYLAGYLKDHYGAVSIYERLPYLVVWCRDKVPPPSERPFLIAGLVAVWLVEDEEDYPIEMDLGEAGRNTSNLGRWIVMDNDLLNDLKPYLIPKTKTLSAIMKKHFPEAYAISYISNRLVVELKQVAEDEHQKRLGSLPGMIAKTRVGLRYHNGSIQGQELKRSKVPKPATLDGQFDDTDYVKDQGCFYPGAMLSSKDDMMISAGIEVEKSQETRLTVAIHCWGPQLQSNTKLGHSDYTVKQGYWKDGTDIGKVVARIGATDIGLVKLEKPFRNRFLDLNGSVSSLLHSNEVSKVNEPFWIDSFDTGPQQMACNGRRIYKANRRGKDLFGEPGNLPGPGHYIELAQGIYATSVPEINTEPKIRAGVCGAAVIRGRPPVFPEELQAMAASKEQTPTPGKAPAANQKGSPSISTPKVKIASGKSSEPSSSTRTTTPRRAEIPEEETTGEVAGFMHWSDLQSVYRGGRLLCFADSVDEMIDEGWTVVHVPEKRKAGTAGVDDDSDPFITKNRSGK